MAAVLILRLRQQAFEVARANLAFIVVGDLGVQKLQNCTLGVALGEVAAKQKSLRPIARRRRPPGRRLPVPPGWYPGTRWGSFQVTARCSDPHPRCQPSHSTQVQLRVLLEQPVHHLPRNTLLHREQKRDTPCTHLIQPAPKHGAAQKIVVWRRGRRAKQRCGSASFAQKSPSPSLNTSRVCGGRMVQQPHSRACPASAWLVRAFPDTGETSFCAM